MSDVLDLALQVACPALWEARMLCSANTSPLDSLLAPRRCAIFEKGRIPKTPPTCEPSFGRLNEYFWQLDPEIRPRASVARVSLLLGKSSPQIRRYFEILRKDGRIPADSFDGYRWSMPDEEVIGLVKEQFAGESRRRAKTTLDPIEATLAELGRTYKSACGERRTRQRKERQERQSRLCEQLRQLFRATFLRQNPGVRKLPEEAEDWLNGDCELEIALYVAQVERPRARLALAYAAKLLGLSRATLRRRYCGKMRDARVFVKELFPKGKVVTEERPQRAKYRYGSDGEIAA